MAVERPGMEAQIATLEERSRNTESTLTRMEKKVDQIEGDVAEMREEIAKALGGFKMFAYLWGGVIAVAGLMSPFFWHLLGVK